jgi:hypothetical protein
MSLSKEEKDAVLHTAQLLEKVLLPYDTADMIIDEVLKNRRYRKLLTIALPVNFTDPLTL